MATQEAHKSVSFVTQVPLSFRDFKALVSGNPLSQHLDVTLDQQIQLEMLRRLKSIGGWVTFFGILVVLDIVLRLLGV